MFPHYNANDDDDDRLDEPILDDNGAIQLMMMRLNHCRDDQDVFEDSLACNRFDAMVEAVAVLEMIDFVAVAVGLMIAAAVVIVAAAENHDSVPYLVEVVEVSGKRIENL